MKPLKVINYVGMFSSLVLFISGIVSKNYFLILSAVLPFIISLNDLKKTTKK